MNSHFVTFDMLCSGFNVYAFSGIFGRFLRIHFSRDYFSAKYNPNKYRLIQSFSCCAQMSKFLIYWKLETYKTQRWFLVNYKDDIFEKSQLCQRRFSQFIKKNNLFEYFFERKNLSLLNVNLVEKMFNECSLLSIR